MKKEYVVPSAEKLTFDYTETVVASGTLVEEEPTVSDSDPVSDPVVVPGQKQWHWHRPWWWWFIPWH